MNDSATLSAPEPLRARKQRETRAALHAAAIDRVLDDGLENATVASIAADAGVSTRTFFNYFESKEAAILGNHKDGLDEDAAARFLAGTATGRDLVREIAEFVHAVFLEGDATGAVSPEKRREAVFRHPVLIHTKMERNDQMEVLITHLVTRRLLMAEGHEDPGGEADLDGTETWRRARMMVHVGGVPLRYVARELKAGKKPADDAFKNSLELFGTILNEMT